MATGDLATCSRTRPSFGVGGPVRLPRCPPPSGDRRGALRPGSRGAVAIPAALVLSPRTPRVRDSGNLQRASARIYC